jgi:uncharacterized membrane protein
VNSNQDLFGKLKRYGFIPWSPYLMAYLVIFMVLWDTKGMTDPNNHGGFPFASFFLTSVFIFLVAIFAIQKKQSDTSHLNTLRIFLFVQLVLVCIGNFSFKHSVFRYTLETNQVIFYQTLVYAIFLLFIFSIFLKQGEYVLYRSLLTASALLSLVVIYCSIKTGIDTHLFLNMASDYFTQGHNPYTYNYPDMYGGEFTKVYGDKYYFNYWPLALYICAPFRFIFGDVRFAFVVAQLIFVAILIRNKQKLNFQQVILISVLWLTNLIMLYVNERSWLDALAVPFFLSALICMKNKKYIWASILIGLMGSLKLYYVFAMPFFAIYLLREKKIKEIFIMGLAFTLTFLPFAIASFDDLYQSTILFINSTKIREDSLSIVSAVKRLWDIDISSIGTVLTFASMGLFFILFWKSKNHILNLAKYINLTFFVIFLLSKQSFCNYFYFNMVCCFVIFYLENNFDFKEITPSVNHQG